MIVAVRLIWRALRQVFTGRWMPVRGLMQAPRTTEDRPVPRSTDSTQPNIAD